MRILKLDSDENLSMLIYNLNRKGIQEVVTVIMKQLSYSETYRAIYWEEVPETPQDSVSISDFGIDEGNAA